MSTQTETSWAIATAHTVTDKIMFLAFHSESQLFYMGCVLLKQTSQVICSLKWNSVLHMHMHGAYWQQGRMPDLSSKIPKLRIICRVKWG